MTNSMALKAIVGLLIMGAAVVALAALPQDRDQQKCINAMNKAAEKVSQAQGKEIYFCLRDASKGRESDVLDCLLRDPRGKVQRMMDKTTRDEAKSCGVAPDFGFAGADAVNEIAREQQVELLLDLLGEDLGSVVHQGEVGNCQAMTVKAYGKVFSTSLKIFNTCKKLALRSGTAVSASDLAGLCFAEVSGDARGKIERMVSKLDGVLGKKCPGLSVSGVFPGVCAAESGTADCMHRAVDCRLCRTLNGADALSQDCDTFDDGLVNASCPACGNDQVDRGEVCDGSDLGGEDCQTQGFDAGALACASDCTDWDTVSCSLCGDGIRSGPEECEVADLAGESCSSQGFDGGTLQCAGDCTFDTGACHACGDGVANGPEQCDGVDLGSATCTSLGFDGGSLQCAGDCTVDTSGCYSCGDGVRNGTEECDASDLDGETCTSRGFVDGTLACAPGCTFDESGCNSSALPPDPSTVAPPVEVGVPTHIADSTAFLYTGPSPIQTGADPAAFERHRASVVRGQVLDTAGAPLPGVTVDVADHPQFGQTLTRADGMFDLVVNGGGPLQIRFRLAGHPEVHRQVEVPWNGWVRSDDVVMTPLSAIATNIDLATLTETATARGEVESDARGSRQATLLFAPGTQATMTLSDGSTAPLDQITVRATEYTVGERGLEAMPAPLPAYTGYNYAVELSVDEAVSAGARTVEFDQPVAFYVEDLLDLPAGSAAPLGWYDRDTERWVPEDDGIVIEVVSVTGGLADLDLDGDGLADGGTALTDWGISEDERRRLGALYGPSTKLWRVLINHFTPWDINWSKPGIDPSAGPPEPSGPPASPGGPAGGPDDDPETCGGSIVSAETQSLAERVRLAGTTQNLFYSTLRAPGEEGYQLRIPLTGPNAVDRLTSPSLRTHFTLGIEVGGRFFFQWRAIKNNDEYMFSWDGKDAYGRTMSGTQDIKVGICYHWRPMTTGLRVAYSGGSSFGSAGGGGTTTVSSATEVPIPICKEWQGKIGRWNALAFQLGGWGLEDLHAYDVQNEVLYRGDGRSRGAAALGPVFSAVAGGGADPADGILATDADLGSVTAVAVSPAGDLYIGGLDSVRKVDGSGVITTVINVGAPPSTGGWPATVPEGPFNDLEFGPSGALYALIDDDRVYRVAPDGSVEHVAGDPAAYPVAGDGGPATDATFRARGIGVGPAGNLFIADTAFHRIRQVRADGTIDSVAGVLSPGAVYCPPFDGGLYGPNSTYACSGLGQVWASELMIAFPQDVAVDQLGRLFISSPSRQVFMVDSTRPGWTVRVAGTGNLGSPGDGTPGWFYSLKQPAELVVVEPDRLYISDPADHRIRAFDTSYRLSTVAGDGTPNTAGQADTPDGYSVDDSRITAPRHIAAGPDGSIYFATSAWAGDFVRRISLPSPALSADERIVPSDDGAELYVFGPQGRHRRTLHGATGAVLRSMTYGPQGGIASITDGDGDVTTVQRDAQGDPTAIVGPDGVITQLALDAEGWLASITEPGGAMTAMTYDSKGRLTNFWRPNAMASSPAGAPASFTYDGDRMVAEDMPDAASWALTRNETSADEYDVTLETALGRTWTFGIDNTGSQKVRTSVTPAGLQTTRTFSANGSATITTPDGTTQSRTQAPDPRFGMLAPIDSWTISTPGGVQETILRERTVQLSDPDDPLSLTSITETTTRNGHAWSSVFDAATSSWTVLSPLGRATTMEVDDQGRPVRLTPPAFLSIDLAYDARGRLETTHRGGTSEPAEVQISYDANGLPDMILDANGDGNLFEWDAALSPERMTLADGRTIEAAFDPNRNLTHLAPPGRPDHSFTHTEADLVASYDAPPIGAGPVQTLYDYDNDRSLRFENRPDGRTVEIAYDAAGRPETVTHPAATVTLGYDASGRLDTLSTSDGIDQARTFDGPLPLSETWSGPVAGTVSWTWAHLSELASESVAGGDTIAYAYDDDGLLTQAGALAISLDPTSGVETSTTLGLVETTTTYDPRGYPATYTVSVSGSDLLSFDYSRDALDRVVTIAEDQGGVARDRSFVYDDVGRLTRETIDGAATNYLYDGSDNRTTVGSASGTVTGTTNDQDQLLTFGAVSYGYGAAGELVTRTEGGQTTTYDYDALGNLRAVALPGGTQVTYLVDANNRRIGKQVGGVLQSAWLYADALNPVAELDGAGALRSQFVYGTRAHVPDFMIRGGVTYRIISDHLGSVRLVIDEATGTVAQALAYDAWGRVLSDTSPGFQPFGFAGGLYDPDTNLVRFGARDYDPEIGRWTAKDPILFGGGQANLYAYVGNDPVTWTDPSGTAIHIPAGIAVGLGGIASGAVAGMTNDLPLFSDAWVDDVVGSGIAGAAVTGGAMLAGLAAVPATLLGVLGDPAKDLLEWALKACISKALCQVRKGGAADKAYNNEYEDCIARGDSSGECISQGFRRHTCQ